MCSICIPLVKVKLKLSLHDEIYYKYCALSNRKSFPQFLHPHIHTNPEPGVCSSAISPGSGVSLKGSGDTHGGKLLSGSICQIPTSYSLPVLISGARGNTRVTVRQRTSHSLLAHLHTFLNPYITHYFYTLLLYPSFGLWGEANLVLFPPFLNKNRKRKLQVRPSRENGDSLSAFSEAGDSKTSITWWRSAGKDGQLGIMHTAHVKVCRLVRGERQHFPSCVFVLLAGHGCIQSGSEWAWHDRNMEETGRH